MKNYAPKLKKLAQQPAWKRALFVLIVNTLIAGRHIIDFWLWLNIHFPSRPFYLRRHPRAHYISAQIRRPHRAVFQLLSATLVASPFFIPADLHLYWATGWGLIFSAFVIVLTLRRLG